MTETPELSPERKERREEIKRLTQRGTELYAALDANSKKRNELILAELNDGALARELAELIGSGVARIYKLRDNAMKEQE